MQAESAPSGEAAALSGGRVALLLIANGLLRVANGAGGALIGFYR